MGPVAAFNAGLRRVPTWPVYVLGAAPGLWLFWLALENRLGADPLKALEHQLGMWGLQLLLVTLCVTPLRRLTGLSLLRFRRALGLLAFGYVVAHMLVWLVLDIQLDWDEALKSILKRPYITIGMIGFAALVPLALTSTDRAIRRLGAQRWARLHRLAYVAVIAGAIHYLLLVKAWPIEPILYVLGAAGLVLWRLWPRRRPSTGPASSESATESVDNRRPAR